MKVLLVDDSDFILERMKEVISEVPCIKQISSTNNVVDFMNLLNEKNPDIVLLDIRMPHKTGIEILKEIKQSYSAIIVIMVTNYATDHYQSICLENGAAYFIDKSTEFEMIPEILENICSSYSN